MWLCVCVSVSVCVNIYALFIYYCTDERIRSCRCHVLAFPLEWRNATPLSYTLRLRSLSTLAVGVRTYTAGFIDAFQWTRLLFRLSRNRRETDAIAKEILPVFLSSFETFYPHLLYAYDIAEMTTRQEPPLVKFTFDLYPWRWQAVIVLEPVYSEMNTWVSRRSLKRHLSCYVSVSGYPVYDTHNRLTFFILRTQLTIG